MTRNNRDRVSTPFGDYVVRKHKEKLAPKVRPQTKFAHEHFIAIDGEGIDVPSKPNQPILSKDGNIIGETVYQSYALLMSNESKYIINSDGLSTEDCFEFLLNCTDDPLAILVVFGGSYDFNMMLRDIPRKKLEQLWTTNECDHKRYHVTMYPRKSLTIAKYRAGVNWTEDKKGKPHRDIAKSVTLWDVFTFFKGSFVDNLETWFKDRMDIESIIEQIQKGKENRGTFTREQLIKDVKPYCELEVIMLEELMHKLHKALVEAGLTLERWDGAGACATALLKKYNVKPHIDWTLQPTEVTIAAEHAYFGGRIEAFRYGNFVATGKKVIHHYDINSAYPDAQRQLQSLSSGVWKLYDDSATIGDRKVEDDPQISLYEISWCKAYFIDETTIGPFPWRNGKGNVYFPPFGRGWVYRPELLACIETMFEYDIVIHQKWCFEPTQEVYPFDFINDVYALRKKYKAEDNSAEHVLKLAMNSVYGKTAQSKGYDKRTKKKPPYHNLVIAGMTTSITRARLLRACLGANDSIIMIATDGIYSTKKLNLEGMNAKEKNLGEWEYKQHISMTIIASGIYWLDDGSTDNSFSRGFDKKTFASMRQKAIEGWRAGLKEIPCMSKRFLTLGGALSLQEFGLWCTWRTIDRKLSLDMEHVAKRVDVSEQINPSQGLVKTYAAIPTYLQVLTAEIDEDELVEKMPFSDLYSSYKFTYEWDMQLDGSTGTEYIEDCANSNA